jgi:2-dehydro-3-deoxyphosphooctonate aldolase (KDO 8-P synthase)
MVTPQPFILIAGPCVLEGADGAINQRVAATLKQCIQHVSQRYNQPVQFYFKSSFDKANRSSGQSYRGPGLDQGLNILQRIAQDEQVDILTDIHDVAEVKAVAEVAHVLQIPAFLCRQTSLLQAAGQTGRIVNIKKGQFLSPPEVQHCAAKVQAVSQAPVWITERGNSFGYNNLVVDMRVFPIVRGLGLPILFDATHSVQQPGGLGDRSGGQRQYAPTLAYAAVAAGCNGLFFETHPDPDNALSDGPNMLPLHEVESFLDMVFRLRQVVLQPSPLAVTAQ